MENNQLSQEEYLHHSGAPCPNCGDTRFVDYIQGWRRTYGPKSPTRPTGIPLPPANHEHQGDVLRRKAMCGECKAEWQDEFRLYGYVDLTVPELPMLPSEAWQGVRKWRLGGCNEMSLSPKARQALAILDEHWHGCARDGGTDSENGLVL